MKTPIKAFLAAIALASATATLAQDTYSVNYIDNKGWGDNAMLYGWTTASGNNRLFGDWASNPSYNNQIQGVTVTKVTDVAANDNNTRTVYTYTWAKTKGQPNGGIIFLRNANTQSADLKFTDGNFYYGDATKNFGGQKAADAIKAPTATFNQAAGEYEAQTLDLTLNATNARKISYSINGGETVTVEPEAARSTSAKMSAPITIARDASVKDDQNFTIAWTVDGIFGIGEITGEATYTLKYAAPVMSTSKEAGSYDGTTLDITLTALNSTSAWYKIGDDGEQVDFEGTTANFTIGNASATEEQTIEVFYGAANNFESISGSYVYTLVPVPCYTVHFIDKNNWGDATELYAWITDSQRIFGDWGSSTLPKYSNNNSIATVTKEENVETTEGTYTVYTYSWPQSKGNPKGGIIFKKGGDQTGDYVFTDGNYYIPGKNDGYAGVKAEDILVNVATPDWDFSSNTNPALVVFDNNLTGSWAKTALTWSEDEAMWYTTFNSGSKTQVEFAMWAFPTTENPDYSGSKYKFGQTDATGAVGSAGNRPNTYNNVFVNKNSTWKGNNTLAFDLEKNKDYILVVKAMDGDNTAASISIAEIAKPTVSILEIIEAGINTDNNCWELHYNFSAANEENVESYLLEVFVKVVETPANAMAREGADAPEGYTLFAQATHQPGESVSGNVLTNSELDQTQDYNVAMRVTPTLKFGTAEPTTVTTDGSGSDIVIRHDNTITGLDNITVENSVATEYFNLNGIKIEANNLTPGIYIARKGTKVTKIIIR